MLFIFQKMKLGVISRTCCCAVISFAAHVCVRSSHLRKSSRVRNVRQFTMMRKKGQGKIILSVNNDLNFSFFLSQSCIPAEDLHFQCYTAPLHFIMFLSTWLDSPSSLTMLLSFVKEQCIHLFPNEPTMGGTSGWGKFHSKILKQIVSNHKVALQIILELQIFFNDLFSEVRRIT